MSFRDDVLSAMKREKRCGFGLAIRRMDSEFAQEVCDALSDEALQSAAIADKLQVLGFTASRWQVARCRKHCECGAIAEASK